MRAVLRSRAAIVTKSVDGELLAICSGRDFNSRSASAIRDWICGGDNTRAEAASGSARRSVAAGPATSGPRSGTVPTIVPCGMVATVSAGSGRRGVAAGAGVSGEGEIIRGRDSEVGKGFLGSGVCAGAPITEMTSDRAAKEILFIGKPIL